VLTYTLAPSSRLARIASLGKTTIRQPPGAASLGVDVVQQLPPAEVRREARRVDHAISTDPQHPTPEPTRQLRDLVVRIDVADLDEVERKPRQRHEPPIRGPRLVQDDGPETGRLERLERRQAAHSLELDVAQRGGCERERCDVPGSADDKRLEVRLAQDREIIVRQLRDPPQLEVEESRKRAKPAQVASPAEG